MVNKREKTRSLVYQMKEDIFRQEAALAELEHEELSAEKSSETTVIPLPKFCHHSTGTVYDQPAGILQTAQLFEERGQMLDRKNLSMSPQKTLTSLHSKARRASDVSPTRSRRNRQNARPAQPDVDGLAMSPAASRSPIQQLFRDKMEGLESGGWTGSSLEVKMDSTGSDADETNRGTSESLAVSSEQLNAIAVSGTASPTFTPTSNGFVKILNADDDDKCSDFRPVAHEGQVIKSAGIKHVPLADATQRSENAVIPADAAAAESGVDDVSKTDDASTDLRVVTSHRDKVITSSENDCKKIAAADSENVESAKARAKSSSRSADKKYVDTVKKDSLKESRVSKKNADTKPQMQTRRRISKEQSDTEKVNHVTDELNSNLTRKSSVPRSARKTRSSDQVGDDSDVLTEQPSASKSVDLRRTGSSSRVRPSNEKSRRSGKICTKVASQSKNDSDLQKELPKDEQHKATAGREQEVPLQDSSALNQSSVRDSAPPQIGSSNVEASDSTSLTKPATLDLETCNKPYFHSHNFRPVELNSSESNDDQSRSLIKYDAVSSRESITVDPPHADDDASVHDTPVLDSNSTSRVKPVNSPNQQESENLLDAHDSLLPKTPASQSENDKKPTPSASKSRLKNRPRVRDVNAIKVLVDDTEKNSVVRDGRTHSQELDPLLADKASVHDTQMLDLNSTSRLKPANSPKQQKSENLLDVRDILLPTTSALQSENVKKPTLSASRSRLKSRPRVSDVDATKILSDDTEKNTVAKDGGKKKSTSRPRRRISSFAMDSESVGENSESSVTKKTECDASPNKKASLTVDSKEETTSSISTNKVMSELPGSFSSESSLASVTTDNRVELNSALPTDDFRIDASASSVTNKSKSDITDVDNLMTSLTSTVKDHLKSPRNLAPNFSALDSMDNLCSTKTDFHNADSETTLPVNQGWKSGLNYVGSQLSEVAKTSTASSRKRAAHLMAGCRHRAVDVKRPPPTIEEAVSDQHTMIPDDSDKFNRPPSSEHPSPVQADSDVDTSASNKCSFPRTPKHVPLVQQTNFNISADTLAESADHFFDATSPVDIATKYKSRLNSSGSDDISEELTKNRLVPHSLTAVVEDSSLWKEEKTRLCERPQLVKYDSVGSVFSGSLLGSPESKTLTSSPVITDSKDSRREALRAELLRKFLPSQLIVSDSIKRRVQDGLQLLSSIKSAPIICSHTRQKLADYLNQSRKELTQERLPLRPIDDKREQPATSLRRQLPVRPRRRVYSEWEFVSGDELTSPLSDVESNSDSDYSVDIEDLTVSDSSVKSSRSLARTRDSRISTLHH